MLQISIDCGNYSQWKIWLNKAKHVTINCNNSLIHSHNHNHSNDSDSNSSNDGSNDTNSDSNSNDGPSKRHHNTHNLNFNFNFQDLNGPTVLDSFRYIHQVLTSLHQYHLFNDNSHNISRVSQNKIHTCATLFTIALQIIDDYRFIFLSFFHFFF